MQISCESDKIDLGSASGDIRLEQTLKKDGKTYVYKDGRADGTMNNLIDIGSVFIGKSS